MNDSKKFLHKPNLRKFENVIKGQRLYLVLFSFSITKSQGNLHSRNQNVRSQYVKNERALIL